MSKNVLFISMDDLNDWVSPYEGYPGEIYTPNLDRLVSTGTTFENAFAQVALCNASRTSVMAGKFPEQTGVVDNTRNWWEAVDPATTLSAVLKDAGYHTFGSGKLYHQIPGNADYIDVLFDEFHVIEGDKTGLTDAFDRVGVYTKPVENLSDWIAATQAVDFLTDYEGTDPFFLGFGLFRPHADWVVPQEYFDLYPLEDITLPLTPEGDLDDVPGWALEFFENKFQYHDLIELNDAWARGVQGYLASISFADAMLGRVLDALDASGNAGDTAIVLWSDNGYHLGDKDVWHKFTLWEEAARVPLIVVDPDAPGGQTVATPVSLVDLFPTVLDIAGVSHPDGLEGESLMPLVADPSLERDTPSFTTMYGSISVRTDGWRLTRYEDGSLELFDMAADQNGFTNLAGDPSYAAKQAELAALIDTHAAKVGFILGGAGDDTIVGTDAADILVGGPGSDTMTGGNGDDVYYVDEASDQVGELIGGGRDTVIVSLVGYRLPTNTENLQFRNVFQEMSIVGNGSDNRIDAGPRSDIVEGMNGDDIISGKLGWDTLYGQAGNDTLYGDAGNDKLFGGAGDDGLDGGFDDDFLSGGTGSDTLYGVSGDDVLLGGDGDDSLFGGSGNDFLSGDAGNDRLHGFSGDDVVFGGQGDDFLVGGRGNDRYDGGEGMDRLSYAGISSAITLDLARHTATSDDPTFGSQIFTGIEAFIAGSGDDRINGSMGDDNISGGFGNDTIIAFLGDDFVNAGPGDDIVNGGPGNDTLFGQDGSDRLVGMDGDDTLRGGLGDDLLLGQDGNDLLVGNEGDDFLRGGVGTDVAAGGEGLDTFLFARGEIADDAITDYDGDKVLLTGYSASVTTSVVANRLSITDGGITETLIFYGGIDMTAIDVVFA